tara:strand:- start:209 stop:844 length:636 start_codon:yes stop_codon:yes gene_type:complete
VKLWNRVFLMDPGRQGEATAALVAAHEAVNAASDYGYNLWETVVGPQGQYGGSALVPDVEAFTSGALMHDDADVEQLARLGSAVNGLVDGRPEDSYWDVRHVLGDWSETPAYATNVIHHAPLPQLGALTGVAIGVAERLHEVVGGPISVCTSVIGTGPRVRLILGWESMAAWADGTAIGMADPEFQERVAAGGALPGVNLVVESNVMRRLV